MKTAHLHSVCLLMDQRQRNDYNISLYKPRQFKKALNMENWLPFAGIHGFYFVNDYDCRYILVFDGGWFDSYQTIPFILN